LEIIRPASVLGNKISFISKLAHKRVVEDESCLQQTGVEMVAIRLHY